MAKAVKQIGEAEELGPSQMVTDTITYLPGPMDPPVTKWRGHTVQANVPKEFTAPAEHFEHARGNKFFRVGNEAVKRDSMTLPATAEQYRAYIVNWLKDPAIQHADQLIARFAKDRDLRTACEVGSDDYAWIATLFMPKLHELSRADELTEPQVATLWISHGINELPWSA
jgi:hypothetical protein